MISRKDLKAQTRKTRWDPYSLELRTVSFHLATQEAAGPLRTERDQVDRELARRLWQRIYGDLHEKLRRLKADLPYAPEAFWRGVDPAISAKVDELEDLTSFETFMTRK